MDYSSCPKNFTTGQTNRMQTALNSATSGRNNLWTGANLTATGVNDTSTCKPMAYGYPMSFTVCTGSSLTVKDQSYNAPVASWLWAGTGGATFANPSASVTTVTFTTAGVQTVSLTASNFAGNSIYTFTVKVINGTPNITGAYIESFETSTPGPVLPSNWTAINTVNGWDVYTGGGATGSNAMYINGSMESPSAVETLETPSYDFLNNSGATFTFKYAYAQKTSSYADKLVVQASSNCGGTWTNIYQPSGSTLSSGSGGVMSSTFYPTPTQFKLYTLTASPAFNPFKTQPNVRIRFVFNEDATNGFGNNFYLDDINFSIPTGINELTQSISFNVVPNPNNGNFDINFTLSNTAQIKYQITDLLGKAVYHAPMQNYSAGENKINIDITSFPTGIYFLQFEMNGQKMARKIIKE